MKRKNMYLVTLVVTCLVFAVACKKTDSDSENTSLQVQSDDQSRVSGEVDAVSDDANVIMNHPSMNGQFDFNGPVSADSSFNGIICDASVAVDTVNNPRTITITYNGTSCFGTRKRTGAVVLSMAKGMHWGDAGAVLSISFQNLKVTRTSDNKSLTLNGTQTITNVSGGRLIELPSVGTITHTITSSNMSLTFDDGRQRTWQVAKQRDFTYSNGVVITASGIHVDGTNQGIAEWGVNRFGQTFVCSITLPLVVRQDCNFRLVSGQIQHIRGDVTTTTTFGLDANGNPTTCPATNGHYSFKVVWTDLGGRMHSFVLPY